MELIEIKTDAAQESQELLDCMSDMVTQLRAKSARGCDESAALLEALRDDLYTLLASAKESADVG